METRVGDSLQSLNEGWENVEVVHVLDIALEVKCGRNPSNHSNPEYDTQRGGGGHQPILENILNLVDDRGGSLEGCMKMATLVKQKINLETVPKDKMCTELEGGKNTNWVMFQRDCQKRESSPSRLLLSVYIEWACEVGAMRNVWIGLKAQFGTSQEELPHAAEVCTTYASDATAGDTPTVDDDTTIVLVPTMTVAACDARSSRDRRGRRPRFCNI